MDTVIQHAAVVGIVTLCAALGLARASLYRRRRAVAGEPLPSSSDERSGRSPVAASCHGTEGASAPPTDRVLGTDGDAARNDTALVVAAPTALVQRASPRALSDEERQRVLDVLHEPRFCDLAPAEVYATLLDEQRYLCSLRTMYRILDANREVRERRDQLRHPAYAAPELLATAPNQLWSWDITKLLGPTTWSYFYLYVILDVFSRYVVGWMVAPNESAELAKRLIGETCRRQGIEPGQLTLHADRGSSMKSKPVAFLLADLGVTKTHSRPHVSDDNPFSEAQFKTLKYRPDFPERFGSLEHARAHCQDFFPWYNTEHHHSGIGLQTPQDVHSGKAHLRYSERQNTLQNAFEAHPERFPNGPPKPPRLPTKVWINPPRPSETPTQAPPREPASARSPEPPAAPTPAIARVPAPALPRGDAREEVSQ
jgi:putative transposase